MPEAGVPGIVASDSEMVAMVSHHWAPSTSHFVVTGHGECGSIRNFGNGQATDGLFRMFLGLRTVRNIS